MVNILCYKSKTLANGEHPLVIRICKDGKKKYQSIGISVKAEHWDFKKNEGAAAQFRGAANQRMQLNR